MKDIPAQVRAHNFIIDNSQRMKRVETYADQLALIDALAAVIEDAEAHAENQGREEMIDSAQENTSLRLQLKDAEETIREQKRRLSDYE